MSDIRIKCAARVIQDACKDRLTNSDDTKEVRTCLRGILGQAEDILKFEAEPPKPQTS